MPRIQTTMQMTGVVIVATTVEYDALAAWLNAAGAAVLASRGILSWSGTRNTRRFSFTLANQQVDVDTAIPLTALT